MAFEGCIEEITKAVGRELEPKERDKVGKEVLGIVDRLRKSGTPESDIYKMAMKEIADQVKAKQVDAALSKRNEALNFVKFDKEFNNLKMNWKDAPGEWLKSLAQNSNLDRFGARNGIHYAMRGLRDEWHAGLISTLKSKNLLDVSNSGLMDLDIRRAKYLMDSPGGENSPQFQKLPKEAREIAGILKQYGGLIRDRANKAGANIGEIQGYLERRSHDQYKYMTFAGKDIPVNDPRHMQAFTQYFKSIVDWSKEGLSKLTPEERQEFAERWYTDFASGKHTTLDGAEGGPLGMKGAGSTAKKLSYSRVVDFVSPEADHEFNQRLGNGNTLLENTFNGMSRMARDTSLMERLGPNPELTLRKIVGEMSKDYKMDKNTVGQASLDGNFKTFMRTTWPLLTGEGMIPENQSSARFFNSVRNVMRMGDLAKVTLAHLSNVAYSANVRNFFGERTGASMFDGMTNAVKEIAGNAFTNIPAEKMRVLGNLGVFLENTHGQITHVDPTTGFSGTTQAMLTKMFRYLGFSKTLDSIRSATVFGIQHDLVGDIGKGMGELAEGRQALFRQFGITPKEWDIIRTNVKPEDIGDGRSILNPQAIRDLNPKAFAEHEAVVQRTADLQQQGTFTDRKISNTMTSARDELADKFKGIFAQTAALASAEPGPIERGWLTQGSRPGTALGEIDRFVQMYKGFITSVMRGTLGRNIYGFNAENLSLPQAMGILLKGQNQSQVSTFANLVGYSILAGYGVMTLKNVAAGKKPMLPDSPENAAKVFMASALHSGTMGIYGDFVFGPKNRYGQDFLATMAGPAAKRLNDVMDIAGDLRPSPGQSGADYQKQLHDAGTKSFNFALQNTPGLNTVLNSMYTKAVVDYLIMNRIHEFMSPGFLQRMQRRNQKEGDEPLFGKWSYNP